MGWNSTNDKREEKTEQMGFRKATLIMGKTQKWTKVKQHGIKDE